MISLLRSPRQIACAALLLALPAPVMAATIRVPADQPSMQAGIDAAVPGDTVLVAPGTYTGEGNRDMDFNGKDIVLRSEAGSKATIIDCQFEGRAVLFQSGETSAAVVDGFTIQFGAGSIYFYEGGAMLMVLGSSPTIKNCTFYANIEVHPGGAIRCYSAGATITNCEFNWNESVWYGGGALSCSFSSVSLANCTFFRNHALGAGAIEASSSTLTLVDCRFDRNYEHDDKHGGGVGGAVSGSASFDFINCTFSENWATDAGGAIHASTGGLMQFRHCTFYGNSSRLGSAIVMSAGSTVMLDNTIVAFGQGVGAAIEGYACPTLVCSDIYGNEGGDWVGCIEEQLGVNGNISADPLFCDAKNGDFTLDFASPCTPGNSPENCGLIGAWSVGCAMTAVEQTTWGAIKATFLPRQSTPAGAR